MSKRRTNRPVGKRPAAALAPSSDRKVVDSLFDAVVEGTEYESLVGVRPRKLNGRDEIQRGIAGVESVRGRPLICYMANGFKALTAPTAIVLSDDLPFCEMIDAVPAHERAVDVLIVTPGGLANQVAQFVTALRDRFDEVSFIVPHLAMSAGTIWALSGNEIWMDSRARLGPIDPQVPGKDGRLIPAQALMRIVDHIQEAGEEKLKQKLQPDWTHIQILRHIDPKELGNALSQSQYSIDIAAGYLETFKFANWTTHSNGSPVLDAERHKRAVEIAELLCSHDEWKMHSHGIDRHTLENHPLNLKIGHPEEVPRFQRELRRLWALTYWLFETTSVAKCFVSSNYSLFRSGQEAS